MPARHRNGSLERATRAQRKAVRTRAGTEGRVSRGQGSDLSFSFRLGAPIQVRVRVQCGMMDLKRGTGETGQGGVHLPIMSNQRPGYDGSRASWIIPGT